MYRLRKHDDPTQTELPDYSLGAHQESSSMLTVTPYMKMSIQANLAGWFYNISAAICSWLVLAAFLVLPNTLTSVKSSTAPGGSKDGQVPQNAIQNVPILILAGIFCLLGPQWC
jgi:hypothetical protein